MTGNGSLVNNKYFSEDLAGYVIVPVNVSDSAGSDVAVVKVYVILIYWKFAVFSSQVFCHFIFLCSGLE